MAKFMHTSILSGLEQYSSHAFFPLHGGGLTPLLIADWTFLTSSNSSDGIKPFFSAKEMHSSMWLISLQYSSQTSLPTQPPGLSPPAAKNFSACASSLSDIRLFSLAKSKQTLRFPGLSQYALQSDSLLQPPNSSTG